MEASMVRGGVVVSTLPQLAVLLMRRPLLSPDVDNFTPLKLPVLMVATERWFATLYISNLMSHLNRSCTQKDLEMEPLTLTQLGRKMLYAPRLPKVLVAGLAKAFGFKI